MIARLLTLILLLCVGCGSAPQREAQTVVAVTAYHSAITVWLWADARTAAEHDAAANMAVEAVKTIADNLKEQCGERWKACAYAAFEDMLQDWEKLHDYTERAERIERARELLELWRASLDAGTPDMTRKAANAANALVIIVDELKARGVQVPPDLERVLKIVSALAHERGISKAPPPAYGNSVVKS